MILNIVEQGNNIVSVPLLYGGTHTLFKHMLPQLGIDCRFAWNDTVEAMEGLIDDKTSAVFCESIGNPAGKIVDIEALAAMVIPWAALSWAVAIFPGPTTLSDSTCSMNPKHLITGWCIPRLWARRHTLRGRARCRCVTPVPPSAR